MITPCTKETTRELEDRTVPYPNLLQGRGRVDLLGKEMKLFGWYRKNGFDTSTPQGVQNARLSELIGFKPQYHAIRGSDQYRNAVWGFEYNGEGCVLYHSKKGLSLQVIPKMKKNSVVGLIDSLIKLLK